MKTTTKPVEASKIFSIKNYQLLQHEELNIFESNPLSKCIVDDYNIYIILSCPKVFINPNYFYVNKDYFEVELMITLPTETKYIKSQIFNEKRNCEFELKTNSDYTQFQIRNKEYETAIIKASVLLDLNISNEEQEYDYMDYNVLYIGKSVGRKKYSNAAQRLKYHKQVKRIQEVANHKYPTKNIWLMLCSFKTKNHVEACLPIKKEVDIVEEINQTNYHVKDELTRHQEISIIEASLINYFKPKYNIHYKDLFPNKNHSTYNFAYTKDLNCLVTELDLIDKNRKLYSKNSKKKKIHRAVYSFHDEMNRMRMFGNE